MSVVISQVKTEHELEICESCVKEMEYIGSSTTMCTSCGMILDSEG
jgi:hypothetical protein